MDNSDSIHLVKAGVARSFILTGFNGKEKRKLLGIVKSLKASLISSCLDTEVMLLNLINVNDLLKLFKYYHL